MSRSANIKVSPSQSKRNRLDQPRSYALPDKKDNIDDHLDETLRKHRRTDRKRKKTPEIYTEEVIPKVDAIIDSSDRLSNELFDELKDKDLNEIDKQVVEARKRSAMDPKAEEERLIRQKWAEEKRIKEELIRRFEIYLQKQVHMVLIQREDEVNKIVADKVSVERERIEKDRKAAEEIRKDMERKERIRKMEEEMKQREELERLAQERLKRLEETKKREEEEKTKKLADQLHQLEEKQRREAAELRKKKKEQELVLNKNKSRARLCFSFNK